MGNDAILRDVQPKVMLRSESALLRDLQVHARLISIKLFAQEPNEVIVVSLVAPEQTKLVYADPLNFL